MSRRAIPTFLVWAQVPLTLCAEGCIRELNAEGQAEQRPEQAEQRPEQETPADESGDQKAKATPSRADDGLSRPMDFEDLLCANGDWVVIGRVAERVSYRARPTWNTIVEGTVVMSTVTIQVERVVHGAPPPSFELTVEGGVINGLTYETSGDPNYDPGTRLFLVLSTGAAAQATETVRVQYALETDYVGILPTNVKLEEIWVEHCGYGLQDGRPTDEYLEYLPRDIREQFLGLCKHY